MAIDDAGLSQEDRAVLPGSRYSAPHTNLARAIF